VVRHQLVRYKESARVGGVAGFEPVKNSIVLARPYHYTRGPLPYCAYSQVFYGVHKKTPGNASLKQPMLVNYVYNICMCQHTWDSVIAKPFAKHTSVLAEKQLWDLRKPPCHQVDYILPKLAGTHLLYQGFSCNGSLRVNLKHFSRTAGGTHFG
jgi:hypothetical protein